MTAPEERTHGPWPLRIAAIIGLCVLGVAIALLLYIIIW